MRDRIMPERSRRCMTCGSPRVGYTTVTNPTVAKTVTRTNASLAVTEPLRRPTPTRQLQSRYGGQRQSGSYRAVTSSDSGVTAGGLHDPNAKAAVQHCLDLWCQDCIHGVVWSPTPKLQMQDSSWSQCQNCSQEWSNDLRATLVFPVGIPLATLR